MSLLTTRGRLTVEDLAALPDEKHFELIDGVPVEKPVMGAESSWIASGLNFLLLAHCKPNRLGWVFGPDCGYHCFPSHPDRLRRPDVSFIRAGRLPGDVIPKGYFQLAPDLAVEVVSPNDLAFEVDTKIKEYLDAGVALVWVVNPETREVRVHRADRTIAGLAETDELTGEDVVPGFRCQVADLFPGARPADTKCSASP